MIWAYPYDTPYPANAVAQTRQTVKLPPVHKLSTGSELSLPPIPERIEGGRVGFNTNISALANVSRETTAP